MTKQKISKAKISLTIGKNSQQKIKSKNIIPDDREFLPTKNIKSKNIPDDWEEFPAKNQKKKLSPTIGNSSQQKISKKKNIPNNRELFITKFH